MKYGASIGKFSVKIDVLNIFGKSLEKWFSRNFPRIFKTAFSKNTAGGMLLTLSDYSLKISRAKFLLTPGGNKKNTHLSKPSTKISRLV